MDLMQETTVTGTWQKPQNTLVYVLAEVDGKVITGTIISENYKEATIQTDTEIIVVKQEYIKLRK